MIDNSTVLSRVRVRAAVQFLGVVLRLQLYAYIFSETNSEIRDFWVLWGLLGELPVHLHAVKGSWKSLFKDKNTLNENFPKIVKQSWQWCVFQILNCWSYGVSHKKKAGWSPFIVSSTPMVLGGITKAKLVIPWAHPWRNERGRRCLRFDSVPPFCKSGSKRRQMMFYTSHKTEFRRGTSGCWFCTECPQYSILGGNSEEELDGPPSASLQGCLRQSLAWWISSFLSREIPNSIHVATLSAESYNPISIWSWPPTIPVSLGLRDFLGYWTFNAKTCNV